MVNLTEMYNTTTQTIAANGIVAYTNISLDLGDSITPAIAGTNTIESCGIYEAISVLTLENTTSSAVDLEFAIANNGTVLNDSEVATTIPANGNETITIVDEVRVRRGTTGNNVKLSVVSPTGATITLAKFIVKKIA